MFLEDNVVLFSSLGADRLAHEAALGIISAIDIRTKLLQKVEKQPCKIVKWFLSSKNVNTELIYFIPTVCYKNTNPNKPQKLCPPSLVFFGALRLK